MKFNGDIGTEYKLSSSKIINEGTAPFQYAYITHKLPNGGSFQLSTTDWTTRPLNVLDTNIIQGLSLDTSNNWIVVPAGTYIISAFAFYGHNCQGTVLRLYDQTNSSVVALSGIGYHDNSTYLDGAYLKIYGIYTFSTQINLRLQQWAENAGGSSSGGLGFLGSGSGNTDPVAGVELTKVT